MAGRSPCPGFLHIAVSWDKETTGHNQCVQSGKLSSTALYSRIECRVKVYSPLSGGGITLVLVVSPSLVALLAEVSSLVPSSSC
jgi:hypothetical protein